MAKSPVFFADFRTTGAENITKKMQRLMKCAGFGQLELDGRFVAIKMHFGELGNLAFLRPNYARAVADMVKAAGGRPFLTDCNTLYVGGRRNALDHLDTAALNGFTPQTVGCNIIIGDGLKGTDEVEVPVPGVHCTSALIGRAVMDADVVISLTHFKGHEMMGIGGAVKNLGMGCGSRGGKMIMHSDGKPELDEGRCIGCGACQRVCAHGALVRGAKRTMTVDHNRCAGCGRCIGVCPRDALYPEYGRQSIRVLDEKTAEYALAVVRNRPSFHISVICDVSPNCDCHSENDAPVIPNIGMLASFDPVALDVACVDLCRQAPRLCNTLFDGVKAGDGDPFNELHPDTHWRDAIEHAVRIGLGNAEYELKKI